MSGLVPLPFSIPENASPFNQEIEEKYRNYLINISVRPVTFNEAGNYILRLLHHFDVPEELSERYVSWYKRLYDNGFVPNDWLLAAFTLARITVVGAVTPRRDEYNDLFRTYSPYNKDRVDGMKDFIKEVNDQMTIERNARQTLVQ